MKELSPRNANTFSKVCSLTEDNKSFHKADIMVGEKSVSIYPDGKVTSGWISISKSDFNNMIDWYNKEQKLRL